MALDYRKCAEELVPLLGGKENLISAAHCATRLRLVVADNSKINQKAIENVDGVKGTFQSNGQFQIIIGTGTVNKVYDEFLAVTGLTAAKTVGDVFVPILPAIVASGLMMGIVEALGHAIPGFSDSDWYGFLDLVSNTAFTFLPVIVAISAARVFGGNLFLGAVIGLMMVHPSLTNGWNAADGYDVWYLFGHGLKIGSYTFGQVNQLGYQGHVIPVIIAVYFMSKLEKWLHKHVPEIIDLFVTPLTTVFVTALLTFMIIGPIFSTAETYVLTGAKWLITAGYGIGATAMGAIYPITVVMGLHHMYNVIEAGMLAEGGLNIWMPLANQERKEKIRCYSFCSLCFTRHHGAGNLRCQPPPLQAVCLRYDRRRCRRSVRFPFRTRCNRIRRNRYSGTAYYRQHPGLPRTACNFRRYCIRSYVLLLA